MHRILQVEHYKFSLWHWGKAEIILNPELQCSHNKKRKGKSNSIPHTTPPSKLLLQLRDLSEGLLLPLNDIAVALRLLSPHAQRWRKEPGGPSPGRRNESRSSWVILPARLLSVLPIRPPRLHTCVVLSASVCTDCQLESCSRPSQRRYFQTPACSLPPPSTPVGFPCLKMHDATASRAQPEKSPFCRCTRVHTHWLNLPLAHTKAVGYCACFVTPMWLCVYLCLRVCFICA